MPRPPISTLFPYTTLFRSILFKSKKIPEQIGFPRLLMNEKSYALQNLEDYSIARYSNGKLVMRFGGYNYPRSEEHTSELQSRPHLVCRLLLEKKKHKQYTQ